MTPRTNLGEVGLITVFSVMNVNQQIIPLFHLCIKIFNYFYFADIFIVHTYFISMIVMSMAALIFLPAAMSVLALTMPCMPPILTSMVYLECRSWVDNGQTGVSFRVGLAITTYYYWTMVTSFIIISIIIVLLYPIEVKLIILEGIKRLEIKNSNTYIYLFLNLITEAFQPVFNKLVPVDHKFD